MHSPNILSGIPPLTRVFSTLFIVNGSVQDTDAQLTTLKIRLYSSLPVSKAGGRIDERTGLYLVDVRVKHRVEELHLGRSEGIVGREGERCLEVATLEMVL